MRWYSDLFDYGMAGGEEGEEGGGDDGGDGNLVPTLIEKLVAPVVEHAVKQCWNPLSLDQSVRLAHVVKEMLVYLEPGECEAMRRILSCVRAKLSECVESRCEIPAWAPVVTAAAPMAESHARRRFGVAVRCLRVVIAWDGVLPTSELRSLACDRIVAGFMSPRLRLLLAQPGECLARIERLIAAIPPDWLTHSSVKVVRDVASTLGQAVRSQPEAHGAAAVEADGGAGKALDPAALVRVLAALGDSVESAAVASLFGVK
jgi:GC-rich sequence DNA-binding factor